MTGDWQEFGEEQDDYDDEIPAVTLGDLRDGDEVCLTFDAEPETFESDEYGEGVRVEAELGESNFPFRDDEGEAIEDGDDVVLVTWSRRLVRELSRFAEEQGGIVGETAAVTKTGDGFDTQYSVVPA